MYSTCENLGPCVRRFPFLTNSSHSGSDTSHGESLAQLRSAWGATVKVVYHRQKLRSCLDRQDRVCFADHPSERSRKFPLSLASLEYRDGSRRWGVKRIGRADQPQQLAGRAGSLRALLLSRRSFSTFSCRCGPAKFQPQRRNECTQTSIYAWRARLSMHILNGWSRQPVSRPAAQQNPRRSGVRNLLYLIHFFLSGPPPSTFGTVDALSACNLEN